MLVANARLPPSGAPGRPWRVACPPPPPRRAPGTAQARGGIGPMVPTTLLLKGTLPDGTEVRREIDEDEKVRQQRNFDMILDPCLAYLKLHPTPHAVCHAVLSARADWVLIGAWNPMLYPNWGRQGHTFLARVAIRYHPAARIFCLPGEDERGVTLRLFYQLLPEQLPRPQ